MAETKIITTGRFRFNNINEEVNKVYKGGNIASRSLWMGGTHIWPSYEIFCVDDNTKFVASRNSIYKEEKNSNTIYTYDGSNYSYYLPKQWKDLDPTGGTLSTYIVTRESSYWHLLSLEITAYTLPVGNTYINFDDDFISCNDKKLNGGNYVDEISVANNGDVFSYTMGDTEWKAKSWLVKFNQDDDLPIDVANKGLCLNFNVPANNLSSSTKTILRITKFFNEFDSKIEVPTEVHNGILCWNQDPNTIYKVQMCWVTGGESTVPISKDVMQNIDYNDTTAHDYWLCIEFGVSYDGGDTYLWNEDAVGELPGTISHMVSVSISGDDADKFTATVVKENKTINKNYVKIQVQASNPNSYDNNTNKTTIYKSFPITNQSNSLAVDESDNGYKTSKICWVLRRYTSTEPWNISVNVMFNGTGVLEKFSGSTRS